MWKLEIVGKWYKIIRFGPVLLDRSMDVYGVRCWVLGVCWVFGVWMVCGVWFSVMCGLVGCVGSYQPQVCPYTVSCVPCPQPRRRVRSCKGLYLINPDGRGRSLDWRPNRPTSTCLYPTTFLAAQVRRTKWITAKKSIVWVETKNVKQRWPLWWLSKLN